MRKRTHRKRREPAGLTPVESVLVRAEWNAKLDTARIHAITGENNTCLLAYCEVIFCVASASVAVDGVCYPGAAADNNIIRGAVNIMRKIMASNCLEEIDRRGLSSGLEAAKRISDKTPVNLLFNLIFTYDQYAAAADAAKGVACAM